MFRKVLGKRLQILRIFGKLISKRFFERLDKFLKMRLEPFWKFGVLLEACFGNVLESSGKSFVVKRLFVFSLRLPSDIFFGKDEYVEKSLEQFWRGLIPFAASAY